MTNHKVPLNVKMVPSGELPTKSRSIILSRNNTNLVLQKIKKKTKPKASWTPVIGLNRLEYEF